ncbi:MAG: hypothetical protein ABIJ57_09275, partial [Pseudomonadota bacterium]
KPTTDGPRIQFLCHMNWILIDGKIHWVGTLNLTPDQEQAGRIMRAVDHSFQWLCREAGLIKQ